MLVVGVTAVVIARVDRVFDFFVGQQVVVACRGGVESLAPGVVGLAWRGFEAGFASSRAFQYFVERALTAEVVVQRTHAQHSVSVPLPSVRWKLRSAASPQAACR